MPKKIIYNANIKEKRLTSLQQSFVSSWTGSIKETCAIANIDYSYGRQLITKPHIKAAIQNKSRNQHNPQILTIQQLQEFWSASVGDFQLLFSDRVKCSELLGKSLGGFLEKIQVEHLNINQIESAKARQVREIASIVMERHLHLLSPGAEEKPEQAVTPAPAETCASFCEAPLLSEITPTPDDYGGGDEQAADEDIARVIE